MTYNSRLNETESLNRFHRYFRFSNHKERGQSRDYLITDFFFHLLLNCLNFPPLLKTTRRQKQGACFSKAICKSMNHLFYNLLW